jgi:hypothetical protein
MNKPLPPDLLRSYERLCARIPTGYVPTRKEKLFLTSVRKLLEKLARTEAQNKTDTT